MLMRQCYKDLKKRKHAAESEDNPKAPKREPGPKATAKAKTRASKADGEKPAGKGRKTKK